MYNTLLHMVYFANANYCKLNNYCLAYEFFLKMNKIERGIYPVSFDQILLPRCNINHKIYPSHMYMCVCYVCYCIRGLQKDSVTLTNFLDMSYQSKTNTQDGFILFVMTLANNIGPIYEILEIITCSVNFTYSILQGHFWPPN